jgi:hypothetical protein
VITHFFVRGIRKPQGAGFGDSPEDEDGVSVIRSHGSNPALRETMNAIWAEDNRVAVVEELSKQLQQPALWMACGSDTHATADGRSWRPAALAASCRLEA